MPSEREQSGVLVEEATGADIADVCGLDAVILGSSRRREFLIKAIETGQCRVARIDDTLAGFAVLEQSFYGQGVHIADRNPSPLQEARRRYRSRTAH